MFVHQHHLRHLLRPDQYTSDAQYRAEVRHLFRPAWHPVAPRRDLARPGDFLTFDLFGEPVLVRNFDGELRAFLNVCPHRHSRLAADPRGNAATLRCRYHGWEFGADGRTRKIPDAQAFRPWDREHSCLTPFRVEACGDVVFVNLTPAGPSLREWAGPLWDVWAADFAPPFRFAAAWDADFACNWKVVLENSLESYHIPLVHPQTFKEYPTEENSWHELEPEFSSLRTPQPQDLPGRAQNWIVRRLGRPVTAEYWHRVRHPHVTTNGLDVHRMIQWVLPTGPATCRYRTLLYTLRGDRPNPLEWGLSRFLRAVSVAVAKRVFAEDATIYAGVQEGLTASPHPGVIGTREERVFAFQQFVDRHCRGASELPVVEADALGSAR